MELMKRRELQFITLANCQLNMVVRERKKDLADNIGEGRKGRG
jgi:hypothetical protein